MAQPAEHIVHIDGVTGSSPVATTTNPRRHKAFDGFFMSGRNGDLHFERAKMNGIHHSVHIEKQMISEQFISRPCPEGCSKPGVFIVAHNEVPAT